MKKYLLGAALLAIVPSIAAASVIQINFSTDTNRLGGPVSGTIRFDPLLGQRISTSTAGNNIFSTFVGPDYTFNWDIFGQKGGGPMQIDLGTNGSQTQFAFYTALPDVPLYLTMNLAHPRGVDPAFLPTSGYEGTQFSAARFFDPRTGAVIGESHVQYSVTYAATAAVPEPTTWAMMIVGVGLVGATLRRRRPITARLAAAA